MKYLILLIALLAGFGNAATPNITGGDYVVTVAGDPKPVPQLNQSDAKNYALKRWNQCFCDVQINQPVIRYVGLSSSSSSSKAPAGSSSSSSSSLPKLVELQFVPSKIKDTEIIDSSVIEYRLYRGTIVDKIQPIGDPVKFVTTPPKEGEEWKLTAFNGIESDFIVVAR